MIDWRLGTMGFGYTDWSGPFYPPSLKRGEWLSHYARYFNAVELDTTFYAAPDPQRVRRWASEVPEDFRFCAKAPRQVTHEMPLDQADAPMRAFLEVMREMGPRLGAVLLQFPPSLTFDAADRLETFLHALPREVPLAVELRNRSWGKPRTLELLRDAGCALVMAEYLTRPAQVHMTADFLYVRWIGEHHRYATHTAEQADMNDSLQWWKAQLEQDAPRAKTIFGFFNDDYAGYAPATCNRFKGMLGLPTHTPHPAQGTLFE